MAIVTNAKIIAVNEISSIVREFILEPEKYRRYESGQFLQLSLENVTASEFWPESRVFSIANSYDKSNPYMRIIVKKNGLYTSRMFDELIVGSSCTIKYSFGDMILPYEADDKKIVMIAGGLGITPFLGISQEIRKRDIKNVKFLYSVKSVEEAFFLSEIESDLNHENISVFCTEKANSKHFNRKIEIQDIVSDVSDLDKTLFYVCGPKGFIENYTSELMAINAKNIYIDKW